MPTRQYTLTHVQLIFVTQEEMILIHDKAMHIYAGNVYSGCLPSINMIVAKKEAEDCWR